MIHRSFRLPHFPGLWSAIVLLATLPCFAMQPEDIYGVSTVGIVDLSPDGRHLLYTITDYDREAEQNRTTLYRRDLDSGQEITLLRPEEKARGAVWRPDGKSIAYVREEEDGSHVWVMDPSGDERRRISVVPHGYGDMKWSPDGTAIAYRSGATVGVYPGRPGEVVVAEQVGYRHLNEGYREGELHQLYLLDVEDGRRRRLVDALLDVRAFAWSPDGTALVIEAKRREDLGVNLNTDLWLVPREGGEPRQLTINPGPDIQPDWRRDGAIVYLRHSDPLCESEARRIVVLTDLEQGDRGQLDEHGTEFDNLIWRQYGGGAYFTGFLDGCIDLFRTADLQPLTPGGWDYWDVRCAPGRVVLAGSSMTISSAICVLTLEPEATAVGGTAAGGEDAAGDDMAGDDAVGDDSAARPAGALEIVIDPNRSWADSVTLFEPRSFQVEVEGHTVHGWYILPAGRRPGERVPLVLSIHGGPEWMYGGYFLPEFHILPESGYAVLFANPTGSTGYGMEFQQAIRGDWVGAPARDLLTCVDWAVAEGWADPERLALMGGSFGGHLAAALTTQSDRFRVAAVDRMTCDLVSFWGTTDEKWFPEWEFFGKPWEEEAREVYLRNSPVNLAGNARTPMLISHGMKDYRCLIAQSETWFSILKANGVPVRFLRFAHEGHGIRDKESQVFYMNELLAWFDRHVTDGQ